MERTEDQVRHEEQMRRVEETLLHISDTQKRAGWKRDELLAMGADQHLIDALDRSITELDQLHTRLMQGTYWYVSPEEMEAAKAKSKTKSTIFTATVESADPVAQGSLL